MKWNMVFKQHLCVCDVQWIERETDNDSDKMNANMIVKSRPHLNAPFIYFAAIQKNFLQLSKQYVQKKNQARDEKTKNNNKNHFSIHQCKCSMDTDSVGLIY